MKKTNSLFSADELLPCPLRTKGEDKYIEPYKEKWDEFSAKYPNATIKQILDFKDELKELAARERNFKAMGVYGMPQWFYLANEAEVLERQARENERRALRFQFVGESARRARVTPC